MFNILSYVGMTLQSEVCLWTLCGLLRIIFDATLFKVNANLKQVWQMNMPSELSLPVQRVLRTMISSVMLVQCFTVYVYIAAYIVLLYPMFMEERPTLVLPWLLLAAIRTLLCELTCLALGLGTCVLLGPARPSCIRFVIKKLCIIFPSFYMWLLVLSYYNILKMASVYKTFPIILEANDDNCGLELAIRRRRTKSLFGEEHLRKNFSTNLYDNRITSPSEGITKPLPLSEQMILSNTVAASEINTDVDIVPPLLTMSNRMISDTASCEDWLGIGLLLPRDTDRILEQFSLMLLQISAYLEKDGTDLTNISETCSQKTPPNSSIECTTLNNEHTDTPPSVGSKGKTASYIREYPSIFRKKITDLSKDLKMEECQCTSTHNEIIRENSQNIIRTCRHRISVSPNETVSLEVKKIISKKKGLSLQKPSVKKINSQHQTKQEKLSGNIARRKNSQNNSNVINLNKQKTRHNKNKELCICKTKKHSPENKQNGGTSEDVNEYYNVSKEERKSSDSDEGNGYKL